MTDTISVSAMSPATTAGGPAISDLSATKAGPVDASIRHRVKTAVVEGLRLEMAAEELDDDESLFGGLGADSTAALEIVVAIEEAFGFEVEDEDLTEELLASVGSLTAYVEGVIGGGKVAAGTGPVAEIDARPVADGHAGRVAADWIVGVDDVPVLLKDCPHCGRMLERTPAAIQERRGSRWLDASERFGLEAAKCPSCGTWMTGRQPR